MLTKLKNTLEKAGLNTVTFPLIAGSKTLILKHGGRILGLSSKNTKKNFFRIIHDLYDPDKT